MDANTYQKEAKRTLIDVPDREIPQDELQLVWAALTLAIKAGKLVEHLKKGIFHQHGIDSIFIMDSIDAITELATMEDMPPIPSLDGNKIMELWVTTGLIGEAAEIAEKVMLELELGKMGPIVQQELTKEAGDLSWYLAAMATQHNLSMNDILITNIEKLQKRYQNGYSAEASRNRVE